MARYLYSELARLAQARLNCEQTNNTEWFHKHTDKMYELVKKYMPSGSGIDCGTKIQVSECHASKLVFTADFHNMNNAGYYDGWTHHKIVVTPSFDGINVRISGRNRNDIKEYLYEVFEDALRTELED